MNTQTQDRISHRWTHAGLLALVMVAAAGCGADDVEPFTGTWTITEGQIQIECPGADAIVIDPTGSVFDNVAVDGDSFRHTDPAGCVLDFTVDGSRAQMVPGQVCTATDAEGQEHTEAKESLVFEIDDDGVLHATGAGVSDGVCQSSLQATALRDAGGA